ncbi:hypothetical protein O181_114160 [Austropuccinia psidii MF-1]|uniref:Uncharacterized protein n=1 Tax=Austropuccinia psidii MF-1 TaxID=1389203 RepID=A0A9Q3PV87_9BASI|nr:hypothetical protein [Austropuccinia psidii MF-1]
MNNMTNNMQGMLTPLMMILQQGQDQAEEQDRIQRARDEEREMLRREREEERRLQEVQMRAEDKQRSDQMHLYMMAMLSKITGIPLDEPPVHLQNASGSGSNPG